MSEIRLGVGLVLVSLFAAGSGHAQSTAEVRARFVALADSAEVLRQAVAAAQAREEAKGPRPDSLRHDGLLVVVSGTVPPAVRAAVPLAWNTLVRRYGGGPARPLPDVTVEVVVEAGTPVTLTFRPAQPPTRSGRAGPNLGQLASAPADTLAEAIALIAGRGYWEAGDSLFNGWRGVLDPVWHLREAALGRLYVELVTTTSTVTRRCFEGDNASCRAVLGVDAAPHPLLASYSIEERPDLVARHGILAASRVPAEWVSGCMSHRDPELCDRVLSQAFPNGFRYLPLGEQSRHALLALTLELGGAKAFPRLRASTGQPIGARLADAAGVPIDSLVSAWRSGIVAARPKSVAVTAAGGWAAMGWVTLLGLLGLGSSRWR